MCQIRTFDKIIQDEPGEEFLVKWTRMDQEKVQHRKTRVDCGRDQVPVSHGSSPAPVKTNKDKKQTTQKVKMCCQNISSFCKIYRGVEGG